MVFTSMIMKPERAKEISKLLRGLSSGGLWWTSTDGRALHGDLHPPGVSSPVVRMEDGTIVARMLRITDTRFVAESPQIVRELRDRVIILEKCLGLLLNVMMDILFLYPNSEKAGRALQLAQATKQILDGSATSLSDEEENLDGR